MAVKLLFFAQCAEWMGGRELSLPIGGGDKTPLSELLRAPRFDPIRPHLRSLKVAVNLEHSNFSAEVHDGDEVAIFPPVCGG